MPSGQASQLMGHVRRKSPPRVEVGLGSAPWGSPLCGAPPVHDPDWRVNLPRSQVCDSEPGMSSAGGGDTGVTEFHSPWGRIRPPPVCGPTGRRAPGHDATAPGARRMQGGGRLIAGPHRRSLRPARPGASCIPGVPDPLDRRPGPSSHKRPEPYERVREDPRRFE